MLEGSLAGLEEGCEEGGASELKAAQLGGVVDVEAGQVGQPQRQAPHP